MPQCVIIVEDMDSINLQEEMNERLKALEETTRAGRVGDIELTEVRISGADSLGYRIMSAIAKWSVA